ncbi:uncharacterized protein [Fopius arisanus]|uniref:PpnK_0 protein n=1 Tax=Fopius arisanus TaxID=64838 RepID=A0A0C9RE48_9HYME|nr:PREDICTED: uncharacterized protein LOC105272044 isoform X3 [Fopius arisanus]
MNSIVWIVFALCLVHQVICVGYKAEIITIESRIDKVTVKNNDPNDGDIKVTLKENRIGSTFRAKVLREMNEIGSINGSNCDTDPDDRQAFIIHLLLDHLEVKGCPIPAGEYLVIKELIYKTDTFDLLPKGFNDAVININTYSAGNENATEGDVTLRVEVHEITESQADALLDGK